ncbi:MAG: aspartyl/glutamyl-tRNA amidotransferase subunit C [Treponema sp.]|jgi:aspartyl-tRNA(Asn)/glutamyl-tRNA(Gln) amidotransferase subunit C|nr:aspartyl/glutamyl-tRNA amidotransferase subunit C [Treponema sp.]
MEIEDLRETAALARITLSESDLAAAFPAFEQMLGYFTAMQGADEDREAFPRAPGETVKQGISAVARTVGSGFFRPDAPNALSLSGLGETLVAASGERDGRFVLIPNVL